MLPLKQLLLGSLLLILGYVKSDLPCVQLDYLYNSNLCCESMGNSVPCLDSIPKVEFEDLVKEVRNTLDDIRNNFLPHVPKVIHKNLTQFCHNDAPIIGGIHYNEFTDHPWYNKPDLYCHPDHHNRLVIIPQYKISNCYFEYEFGGVKYTAKVPYNPAMTIETYHKGTQSKTIQGFCHNSNEWTITTVLKISEINSIVQNHGGVIYRTESTNNHQLKFPCTSLQEKLIGDNHNRVNAIPLCTDFQHTNQIDCESNVQVGAWDHSLPVKMMTQWHTIDLHKEMLLDKLYFTRESGSSYLRFCLTTQYDNPDTYVNGQNYGFDNSEDGHKIDITR